MSTFLHAGQVSPLLQGNGKDSGMWFQETQEIREVSSSDCAQSSHSEPCHPPVLQFKTLHLPSESKLLILPKATQS